MSDDRKQQGQHGQHQGGHQSGQHQGGKDGQKGQKSDHKHEGGKKLPCCS